MDDEPVSGFCGDASSTAWHLIAGPLLNTCAFCRARSHEVALVVGSTRITDVEPVICRDCVDVCGHAIGRQRIGIDEPWYHELRAQPRVRPLGDIDVALDIDRSLAAALTEPGAPS